MEENNKVTKNYELYLVKLGRITSDYKEEYHFFELEQPWAIVKAEELRPEYSFEEFTNRDYVDVFSGKIYKNNWGKELGVWSQDFNICDSYILQCFHIYPQSPYVRSEELEALLEEVKSHVNEPGKKLYLVTLSGKQNLYYK